MVKTIALVILASTGLAAADEPAPAHNKLGFRIGFGTLTEKTKLHTFSLGLQIEHPVFTTTRVFAEYELMWLGEAESMSPATDGMPYNGHRSSLGIRSELLGTSFGRDGVHLYIDAEIGGGLGVVSDDISGVQVLPHAFVGVRGGYDFLWGGKHAGSSRVFEAELLARAFRMPDGGRAVLFGVGMLWGD
jgi:hypothetical protein